MDRKIASMFIVLVLTVLFNFSPVLAYDYVNSSNLEGVNEYINEIYLSKELYEDLAGKYVENETTVFDVSEGMFWWPVGSSETNVFNGKTFATGAPQSLHISSPFGYRVSPVTGKIKLHGALDISAGGYGEGVVNIIAAQSGIVIKTNDGCPRNYNMDTCGNCGMGYGNYIIIQHSDGNYTLYAHLQLDSVTVVEGESVQQGQVIAKMGSSGCSTGAHLHFEVRQGTNSSSATVDPLIYISADNPRADSSDLKIIEFIHFHECSKGPEISGDKYLVYADSSPAHLLTVGWGIYIDANRDAFVKKGIDPNTLVYGASIDIEIVDQMEKEIRENMQSRINSILSNAEIVLKKQQKDALLSFMYNIGNINGFVDMYKKYGDTEELYENYFSRYVYSGGSKLSGLVTRRYNEWKLFHDGVYK